jgi:XTP/dITP diphosphohydrolase
MELVLATRNKKKIEEITRILKDLPVRLYTLDDFPGCPEVVEDADSFEGNAVKKAKAVSGYTQKPALSDDSGLEVYALKNAPGVLSARYAGENADDQRNVDKLLSELSVAGDEKRGARFVCCIALSFPDGGVETFVGAVEGRIGEERRGSNGFGYDPVFYPEGHSTTFAEMSAGEKDSLSHRGRALENLRAYLRAALAD